jgi:hypothetical protein
MIFPGPQLSEFLKGRKTTHRIPDQDHPPASVGDSRPVKKSHKHTAECRAVVTEKPFLQRLGDVTYRDVLNEGVPTTEDFKVMWVRQHDRDWVRRQTIQLERHTGAGDDIPQAVDILALGRFDDVWADRYAWVIPVALDRAERPRFLASHSPLRPEGKAFQSARKLRPRQGTTKRPEPRLTDDEALGYTSSAFGGLPGEAEAVNVDDLHPRWREDARARLQAVKDEAADRGRQEREELALHQRIMLLELQVDAHGGSVERELFTVRSMIRQGRSVDAVTARVAALERRWYREAA